jgi:chaperonin GroEL
MMLRGALRVSKCVSLTLGPGGRLVMLNTSPNSDGMFGGGGTSSVQVTKDGVTVARALTSMSSHNRLTNLGAKLVIDAAERANETCGDGTTTSTLIAGYIMSEGVKLLHSGAHLNPV